MIRYIKTFEFIFSTNNLIGMHISTMWHSLNVLKYFCPLSVHCFAKSKPTESMPFLLHYGSPSLLNPSWRAQSHQEEKSLIEKLIAPWGGTSLNEWGYISSGGSESNLATIKFALKQFRPQKPIHLFSSDAHHSIRKFFNLYENSFSTCINVPIYANGEMAYTLKEHIRKSPTTHQILLYL